jgi:hypothetical protein
MKAYTLLYDDVMPELPGCDLPLALHHIKRTCNDFYDSTMCSRETLALMDVTVNVPTYAIVPSDSANFDVDRVLEVRLLNGSRYKKLDPTKRSTLDIFCEDWDTQTGTPTQYLQDAVNSVTLVKIPDTTITGGLKVTIAKVPLYAGAGIDDDIFAAYAETLAKGVKARLMRMAKKPWTNQVQGATYAKEYGIELSAAAVLAAKGFGRAPFRSRVYA